MKKFIRPAAILLIAAITALSLCSCKSLDDKKAHQAIYTGDDHLEIRYNDSTYRFIYPGSYSFIDESFYFGDGSYYVTKKDVPVLLSGWYGDYFSLNRDKTLIWTSESMMDFQDYIEYKLNSDSYYDSVTYIREDMYDKVKAIIDSGKLDHFYFEYWSYDKYYGEYEYSDYWSSRSIPDDSHKKLRLTDELCEVINTALKAPKDEMIKYTKLSESTKMISLYRCDSDMILTDSSTYYLIMDKDGCYFWNGSTTDAKCIYPLSEDGAEMAEDIFSRYTEAAEDDSVSWYFGGYETEEDETDQDMMGV